MPLLFLTFSSKRITRSKQQLEMQNAESCLRGLHKGPNQEALKSGPSPGVVSKDHFQLQPDRTRINGRVNMACFSGSTRGLLGLRLGCGPWKGRTGKLVTWRQVVDIPFDTIIRRIVCGAETKQSIKAHLGVRHKLPKTRRLQVLRGTVSFILFRLHTRFILWA